MARFRNTSVKTKVINKAGGEAFRMDAKLELVSLLLTSFVNDKFYEKANDQLDRMELLVESIKDKKFIAQAAVFARKEYGMRSITHALLAELVHSVKGEEWTKRAIAKATHRPDDLLEILAYYAGKYGKPIPNSLKKGLALAVGNFDSYQLAKYRGERSDVKMVDLFNLVHPTPTGVNEKTFAALMTGSLKNTGKTWEANLSATGQNAETEEEKDTLKSAVWADMLEKKSLGYFALLKNLRNIEQQAPQSLPLALAQLKNPDAIKASMVLPFRFLTAAEQVTERKTKEALSDALEISVNNVPKLEGRTLIVLDGSGSMDGKPFQIGSLFASVLYKSNPDADYICFADSACKIIINGKDSLHGIQKQMEFTRISGGTDFHCIFTTMDKPYDRVIILSDMQGWIGYSAPTPELAAYERKFGVKPFIYSFDLNGYGSLQFPQDRVFAIAGFSEKIFDLFGALEQDRLALIHKIESIVI